MTAGFRPDALERRYAFLDGIPERLFDRVVTLPLGSLEARVEGVRRWRDALLTGALPGEGWPEPAIAAPVRRALEALGIARFCRDQPALVDALLEDLLAAFARQGEFVATEIARELAELERLERVKLEIQRAEEGGPGKLDAEGKRRVRALAQRRVMEREWSADEAVLTAWQDRVRVWSEVASVFDDLGQMLGRGWDLSPGVLRHTGWLEIHRLRALLEQLPQIAAIVRTLGRLHDASDGESVAERVLVPVRRLAEERREVRSPLVPGETRGIERSDELARMLPSEASLLGHPRLRLLWHARRAERALLTYRVEGTEVLREVVERDGEEWQTRRRPRPERGPIVAVIDTSGSMHGAPEHVAKALVLECLRTAHAERRRCLVFAYGGNAQVVEHELDLSPEGIAGLLAFLTMSFGGGNDELGVMQRVVARLRTSRWARADVVWVSDGEWPAKPALTELVSGVRDEGTRFHGVQIGNRGRTGLHAICDPVHVLADWLER